ncbi:MAG: crossover junction endodeoxyribonuclease RuvC [bacterium]|nr:crossover junction endodeoxyribonuclease RuvC [bacterium]
MQILGIDPGTVKTGFGMIRAEDGKLHYVDCGVIRTSAKSPIAHRLKAIYGGLKGVIERFSPHVIAVENIFIARNVNSALKLGHARGVAILAAVNSDLEVFEYTPAEVKKAVAGNGRAGKEQVQEMVRLLLSASRLPHSQDASDALALAICHSQYRTMRERLQQFHSR